MSVKASNWVWHRSPRALAHHGTQVSIVGQDLVILLALADVANDRGECIHGDPADRTQSQLAHKARVSESTFRRRTKKLAELGLIDIVKIGLQNSYTLNIDLVEPELSTTGQNDRLGKTGRNDRYYRSAVTGHRNVNVNDLNQSLPNATTERGSSDDDRGISEGSGWASGRRRRKAEKHLDQAILEQLVGDLYADFPAEHRPDLIRNAALFVVGKAISSGSRLTDPTAYVAASIRREPEVHRRRAFEQAVHL